MKKSTLITTIAMIVVVVVALSTATYAWFSSATTTSVSDSISTSAQANWIIMGGKQTTNEGTDSVVYSSSNAIALTMLDGLYSPVAEITAKPSNASNSVTFGLTKFYNATQDGTGLVSQAMSAVGASYDPITETGTNIPSAANYIRVINTMSAPQNLVLTVSVFTDGQTDSDFIAANAFSTYIGWTVAPVDNETPAAQGYANTRYFYGDCATTTSTNGNDTYYVATRTDEVAKTANLTYSQTIDVHNFGMRAGNWADPSQGYVDASDTALEVGEETIESGYYYQFKITITENLPTNAAVNIAFYAWFDGWALDNTGANSGATVYYEFGDH